MELFSNLPTVQYSNHVLRNLLYRPKLVQMLDIDGRVFFPYVIPDGERIDVTSYLYYDSSEYIWLIMLANDILDPYTDWPMSSKQFQKYIISKYGSESAAQQLIKYKEDSDGNRYSVETTSAKLQQTNSAITDNTVTLTNVTAYDYEYNRNETKRHIRLIDKNYIPQINSELKSLYG